MVNDTRLKFSEFIDLLLAELYELEQQQGAGKFFFLNDIARRLKNPPPEHWVFDAGKVLESRGLAQCIFTMGGYCQAMLSGEGRLFVEREDGTGIIRKFHREPRNYIVITGNSNQVAVDVRDSTISQLSEIERSRQPAFNILKEIRNSLENDPALTSEAKSDAMTDISSVEQQLKKQHPNLAALAGLLEPLSQITSIAGYVANLIKLLNP
jgi:hypothetical protein